MPRIDVHRYDNPVEFIGYIEPEDLKWVVYLHKDGSLHAYNRKSDGTNIGNPAILKP